MLAGLVWRPRPNRLITLIAIEVAAVWIMFAFVDGLQNRFVSDVVAAIPTSQSSDYYRVMGAGIAAFQESPVLGLGPATYRDLCPELVGQLVTLRSFDSVTARWAVTDASYGVNMEVRSQNLKPSIFAILFFSFNVSPFDLC